MAGSTQLVDTARTYHGGLAAVLREWVAAVRALRIDERSCDEQLRALVLPVRNLVDKPLDPRDVLAGFPAVLVRISDDQLRSKIRPRLQRLSSELIAANGEILRVLSDLACEAASYRTLILPGDAFDVSRFSVMAAAGLVNLCHVVDQLRRHGGRGVESRITRTISVPLEWALAGVEPWRAELDEPLRPGDLWVLDLIARTVRRLYEAVHREPHAATKPHGTQLGEQASVLTAHDLLSKYAPRFNSMSLLHKLLEADRLEPSVAQKSQYTLWPGLETLLEDSGAEGLRSLVVGELSRRVANDRVGLSRGAFFRFLEALLKTTEPRLALRARLLVARLLWEIFEQAPRTLNQLMEKPQVARLVIRAIATIEQARQEQPAPELRSDHRRLIETCSCLRSYEQYNGLLSIQTSPGGLGHSARTTVSH